MQRSSPRSGFTCIELAFAVVTVAGILALLLLSHSGTRRLMRVHEDLSHFSEIAVGTSGFAADNDDRFWGLSWQSGVNHNTEFSDLNLQFQNDMTAARAEVTYIVRTWGNRPDVPNLAGTNVFVHPNYGHLVLAQYLGLPIPNRLFVSSADVRLKWADDPAGYDQGLYSPHLGYGGSGYRHPYGGSFRLGAAFFDQNPRGHRCAPVTTSQIATNAESNFAPRHHAEVAYPSQKALVHDSLSRHFGPRVAYAMADESRIPVLMCDGSAAVRAFAEANRGWSPNGAPSAPAPLIEYTPSPIEPPVGGPNPAQVYPGPLWTRSFTNGRDFGGPDVYEP